jgi:hemoglobin-like flavoprotein
MLSRLEFIQASLHLLDEQHSTDLTTETYAHFFQQCPSAKSLWEKDDHTSRIKMLNGVLLSVIDSLTRPDMAKRNLAIDVKEHIGYGVKDHMYALFFDSLLHAFKQVLTNRFTLEMEQAWTAQFDHLVQTMTVNTDHQ